MAQAGLRTKNGDTAAIAGDTVEVLRGSLRGSVCLPDEPGYDDARTIWNAMIDRRPGAVVRCAGAEDVVRAVRFAREHDLLLAVRSGGHNIAGNAVCDGGLLIDLSPMKSMRVDPAKRTARVEPGATLGEFDQQAQAFGLATPVGINSTTGIAGLTLGGGFGWISRKYGLSVDNLRGGSGNFGVVTSFEFRLHPVGPEVLSGLIVHPYSKARQLFDGYRRFVAEAPDELTTWVVLRKAPPLPFLPEDWHGKEVMVMAACYAGDMAAGERAMAPLRSLGEPIVDVVSPHPFVGWQAAFDPLLTPGARNYWKSHDFVALGDGAVDAIVDYAGRLPTPECEIFVAQLGGAVNRVAPDATAYPHRDAGFVLNVHTRWREPGQDAECVQWARQFFDQTAPYATGGVYVNFMPEDETDRTEGAYGANYDRLAAIKAKYDPGNLFRMNQNIQPAS
jgi:FAD/FMN-containing dehydrogenase